MAKAKKKKRGFLEGYETYDTKGGYGSPDEWRSVFNERFGFEKAAEILGAKDPYLLLCIDADATWEQVVAAYRKMARVYHPDISTDPDSASMMKHINAAFEVLERRFGK